MQNEEPNIGKAGRSKAGGRRPPEARRRRKEEGGSGGGNEKVKRSKQRRTVEIARRRRRPAARDGAAENVADQRQRRTDRRVGLVMGADMALTWQEPVQIAPFQKALSVHVVATSAPCQRHLINPGFAQ
ncbi:hypothetical protein Syun_013614 [Stephania yunnanensis]|uniref:Uncharacterized protein n=1 Tax=Stephania yunnanensis TaxID=152371 RepID=A0AAP0JI69_9MAGN